MSQITHLSNEWRSWITDNLARGCTKHSLIDAMVSKGFDAAFANSTVTALVGSSGVGATTVPPAKDSYIYNTPSLPTGNIIRTSDRDVQVQLRVNKPVVAVLGNLLSHDECDELIRRSVTKLERSSIVDPVTGKEVTIDDRSSEGTYFRLNEDDFIARLDHRIAELMHVPVENGEGLQILHYGVGGEYTPHFDYFPPSDPGSAAHLVNGGQRTATLVIYLNDVEDGGATIFPEIGLEVVPKKGSAVYFEYANEHGQLDPLSLHGGLPVGAGEKWIATKWVRERRYESAAG